MEWYFASKVNKMVAEKTQINALGSISALVIRITDYRPPRGSITALLGLIWSLAPVCECLFDFLWLGQDGAQ